MAKAEYKIKVIAIGPVVTTATDVASAFNEWLRLTIEEPEMFLREWQQVMQFQSEEAQGEVPSYGRECTSFLLGLLKRQQAKGRPVKRSKVKARKRARVKR